MAYSRAETIEALAKAFENPQSLYQSNCVNWKGRAKDTHEYYSEIIVGEMISSDKINQIDIITRSKSYHRERISDRKRKVSNRVEELFAKALFNSKSKLRQLGTVLDFQVPIKNKRSDKAGKIDLVSSKGNSVYLIELKGPLNRNDTLLRAVFEIWTYLKQVDGKKLLRDHGHAGKRLQPAVLLFPGTLAAEEALRMSEMPNLKKLVKFLKVKIYTFEPREN
jgi:predicted DNA-binding ArsR family transcriptional regulator